MRHIGRSALLAALLAGCGVVTSLEPLSEPTDRVFDSALLGAWTDDSARMHFVFTPGEDGRYLIAMADGDGKTGRFVGELTRLNGRLVLDISPEPLAVYVSDLYRDLLRPLHAYFWIDMDSEQLTVSMLATDSLRAQLRENPSRLAHIVTRDCLLLTAETSELRAFLTEFSRQPGVIDSVSRWRRP